MKRGFTLLEMVVVLVVLSLLFIVLTPSLTKHVQEVRRTQAVNDERALGAALLSLYKDTGYWPFTNADGPSGGINRLLSGESGVEASQRFSSSSPGAFRWGSSLPAKSLGDFLFFNNPDDDSGINSSAQSVQDYPSSGESSWRGPYIDRPYWRDPWGGVYVVNARYFPGNPLSDKTARAGHRLMVLSAGPDGVWQTPFDDNTRKTTFPDDSPGGDDVAFVFYTND